MSSTFCREKFDCKDPKDTRNKEKREKENKKKAFKLLKIMIIFRNRHATELIFQPIPSAITYFHARQVYLHSPILITKIFDTLISDIEFRKEVGKMSLVK